MRVAVIRGDLPSPVFLADLEPVSQLNYPTEPAGQTRYISRPSTSAIAAYLTSQGLSASASGLVAATVPVGGPVDVSSSTIKGVSGLSSASQKQVAALQDLLAPRFVETDVVIKSFEVGNLAALRSSNFTPDKNRLPTLSTGAAVAVVQDDGVTEFTAPLPTISGAVLSSGVLTLSGSGLGQTEYLSTTRVKVTLANGKVLSIPQALISRTTGGSVSSTSIVLPAALVPGVAVGDKVQVKFTSLASNVATVA